MWMRVDDGLHAHRKTRAVTKSHEDKRRDAGPMGLWVLAGSWSGRNNQDGWVPCEELDRFDDDWEPLAYRLVAAGFWWPEKRNGEDGYGFNDWGEWNNPTGPSASGTFGNHVRWHANKGVVKDDCEHCPKEPTDPEDEGIIGAISGANRPDDRPDIAPESGGESGGESLRDHRPESLTRPDPTRARPEPEPTKASSDKSDHAQPPERFEEFWETYGHKVGRKKSEVAYRNALKKPGVTADLLIAAAAEYVAHCRETDTYLKNPLTWLHGEHWTDERAARRPQLTRVQEHLTLVQQLAAEEADQPTLPQIGTGR